jgi:hypothetical protein
VPAGCASGETNVSDDRADAATWYENPRAFPPTPVELNEEVFIRIEARWVVAVAELPRPGNRGG